MIVASLSCTLSCNLKRISFKLALIQVIKEHLIQKVNGVLELIRVRKVVKVETLKMLEVESGRNKAVSWSHD